MGYYDLKCMPQRLNVKLTGDYTGVVGCCVPWAYCDYFSAVSKVRENVLGVFLDSSGLKSFRVGLVKEEDVFCFQHLETT